MGGVAATATTGGAGATTGPTVGLTAVIDVGADSLGDGRLNSTISPSEFSASLADATWSSMVDIEWHTVHRIWVNLLEICIPCSFARTCSTIAVTRVESILDNDIGIYQLMGLS